MATIRGPLNCLISRSFISPGQEEGNIPFVEDAGFGKYSGDPEVIADTVASWLSSPETLASMREAALAAARPQATLDIARDLAEIVFGTKQGGRAGSRNLKVVAST
jgi:1,2-diacylglycerol 3-beta-galactosyltransferase